MKKILGLFFIIAVLTGCNSEKNDILLSDAYVTEDYAAAVASTEEETAQLTETQSAMAVTTEDVTTEEETTKEETSEEMTTVEETTGETVVYERLELAETMADADCSVVALEYEHSRESIAAANDELAKKHNVPVISITTEGGAEVDKKTEFVPAVVDIVGCEKEYLLSATAGVRVRGNSTAGTQDKPYRIKFEEKQNMLGLHAGEKYKSWVLLKADWNVCSDYTGLSLADVILDDYVYSSDCRFVQVYINGVHKGLYTLCEQNQVNDGRVDIKEADLDAKDPEAPDKIGYFLEIDNNASEENPYFSLDYNGVTVTDFAGETRKMCKDNITVKSDITTKEQYEFIKKYMKGTFTILYEACCNDKAYRFDDDYDLVAADDVYTPEQAVFAVIDVDSFVNMTILYELCQDYDVGAGSFYFAVDFSEGAKLNRLTCVAPWDFNWGYEEDPDKCFYACAWLEIIKDNWDRSNIWLIVPMTAKWYQQRVSDRWKELSKSRIIDKVLKEIDKDIEVLQSEVGDKLWRIKCAREVLDFVKKRMRYLTRELL